MSATYRGPERRHDHERRRRVAEMSREELVREILTDDMTGHGNRRAFDEAEREGPAQAYAALDLEGLKWLNDTYGHGTGDAAISAAGTDLVFLVETAKLSGVEARAYRTGGDEFVVRFGRHEPRQADALLAGAARVLAQARVPVGAPAGILTGLRIRWGYGPTLEAADEALLAAPRSGDRGEQPRGTVVLRLVRDLVAEGGHRTVRQALGPVEPLDSGT